MVLNSKDIFNLCKIGLAGILFLGYYVLIGIAAINGVPTGGENIILQGIAMIGPVIGAVASNMFPKNEDRTEGDQQTISTLADKVPPPTVPASEVTPPEIYKDEKPS